MIMEVIDTIAQISNPKDLIQIGGLLLLTIIIFAETGLFFGFFLPGDSLLFAAGIFCGTPYLDISILTLLICLNIASILGYITSYIIGSKMAAYLLYRDDSFFFRKKYIVASKDFYIKHGGISIIVGRFFPIIRTFIPIVAGLSQVSFKKFMFYNILGSFFWIGIFVLGGYYLGKQFPGIFQHLEWIIIGMGILTALPLIIAFFKNKKDKKMRKEEINA